MFVNDPSSISQAHLVSTNLESQLENAILDLQQINNSKQDDISDQNDQEKDFDTVFKQSNQKKKRQGRPSKKPKKMPSLDYSQFDDDVFLNANI